MTALLFALAAGCGGVLRYALDLALTRLRLARVSLATAVINTSGSFLLGLLTGLAFAAAEASRPDWLLVAGTGFLGGYTTLSTASVETARLLRAGRVRAGIVYGCGMLLAALLAAALGVLLGLIGGQGMR